MCFFLYSNFGQYFASYCPLATNAGTRRKVKSREIVIIFVKGRYMGFWARNNKEKDIINNHFSRTIRRVSKIHRPFLRNTFITSIPLLTVPWFSYSARLLWLNLSLGEANKFVQFVQEWKITFNCIKVEYVLGLEISLGFYFSYLKLFIRCNKIKLRFFLLIIFLKFSLKTTLQYYFSENRMLCFNAVFASTCSSVFCNLGSYI